MNETETAVAIYDAHTEAESAMKTLQRAGFDLHGDAAESSAHEVLRGAGLESFDRHAEAPAH